MHVRDCRQRTPLHIAALHGHLECAKYLMDFGARAQVYDEERRTPLIAASQFGQTQVLGKCCHFGPLDRICHSFVSDLLVLCTIDRTSCDKLGNTALHWACIKKYTQTALLLLEDEEGDVAINVTNSEKKT